MTYRELTGVPAQAPLVEVDGVSLGVSVEGEGAPVVCLHAVGHGGGDFDHLAGSLKDRYRFIRIDWPGQGRSGPDHQPASAARYAELLIMLLDRLNIERPIIVGNSIGGATALLYAAQRPVAGLVLCDPGGLVAHGWLVRVTCRLFSRFFAAGARGAGWFGKAFAFYYRWIVLPAGAARQQRERIVQSGYETAAVLQQAWTSFGQPDADIRSVALQTEAPVWFAWAASDRVIPLFLNRSVIRRMPNARLSRYKGGHSAFLEQPERFVQEFQQFARSVT